MEGKKEENNLMVITIPIINMILRRETKEISQETKEREFCMGGRKHDFKNKRDFEKK